MFDATKIKYINYCGRHGYDIHDGTKNECCNECSTIPMLNREALDALNDKGVETFVDDFAKFQDFAKRANGPAITEAVTVFIRETKEMLVRFNQEITESNEGDEGGDGEAAEYEAGEEFDMGAFNQQLAHAHLEGYTLGFKEGFREGFKSAAEVKAEIAQTIKPVIKPGAAVAPSKR